MSENSESLPDGKEFSFTESDNRRLVAQVDGVAQTTRDLEVLAHVGRMYLVALDGDPEHEMLTLPEAIMVTEVREAVARWCDEEENS